MKQSEIKIGDKIYFQDTNSKFVVTRITDTYLKLRNERKTCFINKFNIAIFSTTDDLLGYKVIILKETPELFEEITGIKIN